jgi:hypothetical protein
MIENTGYPRGFWVVSGDRITKSSKNVYEEKSLNGKYEFI